MRGPPVPRLAVLRQFEPNRLAGDCQARVYEAVMPVAGSEGAATTMAENEVRQEERLCQEGVAA